MTVGLHTQEDLEAWTTEILLEVPWAPRRADFAFVLARALADRTHDLDTALDLLCRYISAHQPGNYSQQNYLARYVRAHYTTSRATGRIL